MEYLDIYDENKNPIGMETRDVVHRDALWHNTVHCWLYDKEGNVYFQIRADEKTFYTTASGHVLAGESIKEAFGREIIEEIGLINIDYEKAELVDIVIWKMDKEKADGTIFKDRAFANIYACEFNGSIEEFNFNLDEVNGIVKVNAKAALKLFEDGSGEISGLIIISENGVNVEVSRNVDFKEFLVNKHETAIDKYGQVLNKVINLTNI